MKNKASGAAGWGALELMEEAVHLLRMCPWRGLLAYYVGSLPFVLGFLFFWADMSKGAHAYEHLAPASLVMTLLYFWMKCWQTVFASSLLGRMTEEGESLWTFLRIRRLVMHQVMIQPYLFFVLPAALVLTIPFGWVYAFFHNASCLGDGRHDFKTVLARAREQAGFSQGQNHILLLILFGFGAVIFLNLGTALFLLPQMLKTFLGVETVFTLSRWHVLNTTFLAVLVGLTYLATNPLVKAVYALRCHYGLSRQTGVDLLAELASYKGRIRHGVTMILLACVLQSTVSASEGRGEKGHELSPQQLNESLDRVMNRAEYEWRLPREKIQKNEERGFLAQFFDEVGESFKKMFHSFRQTWKRIRDWWDRLRPHPDYKPGQERGPGDWRSSLQILLFLMLAVIASVLAILFLRRWKRRGKGVRHVASEPIAARPNLEDESVQANQLPSDEWLALAQELLAKGEMRLALRAFYLASIALLGHRELIVIAKHKSNRDYVRELERRAHAHPGLLEAFRRHVGVFERVWYGLHPVTEDTVAEFRSNHEGIARASEPVREEALVV